MRHNVIVLALLLVGFVSNPASAGIMLILDHLPASYTPGEDFSFQVRLEGVTNLNSFYIELRVRADRGIPDVDFFLNEGLTGPPDSRYVFGHDDDSLGFLAGSVVLGNDLVISLSDLLKTDDEVTVIGGVNDVVANVVISTTRNVGNLTLEFDTEFLELFDAQFQQIPGFDEIEFFPHSAVVAATPTSAIPEPASLLLWLIAFCGVLGAGRCRWSPTRSS